MLKVILTVLLCRQAVSFTPSSNYLKQFSLPRLHKSLGSVSNSNLFGSCRSCKVNAKWVSLTGDSQNSFSDESMLALLKRVAHAKSRIFEMPVVVLDAMLPRQ